MLVVCWLVLCLLWFVVGWLCGFEIVLFVGVVLFCLVVWDVMRYCLLFALFGGVGWGGAICCVWRLLLGWFGLVFCDVVVYCVLVYLVVLMFVWFAILLCYVCALRCFVAVILGIVYICCLISCFFDVFVLFVVDFGGFAHVFIVLVLKLSVVLLW